MGWVSLASDTHLACYRNLLNSRAWSLSLLGSAGRREREEQEREVEEEGEDE
jgi:hypothetical protein